MRKWEYKVIFLLGDVDKIGVGEETLNKYGAEGWQLVCFDRGLAHFKRPLWEEGMYPFDYIVRPKKGRG